MKERAELQLSFFSFQALELRVFFCWPFAVGGLFFLKG